MISNTNIVHSNNCKICINKNYICGHELYNILKSLEYVLYNNTNSTIKYKISHYILKKINTYICDNIIKKTDLTTILFDNIDFILINNSNRYIINLRNSFENYFINFNKYFYKLIKTINIDYIIDDNKLKQNFFSPGKKIPIKSFEYALKKKPDVIIVLAWNFFDSIVDKCKKYFKNKVVFIKAFPKIKKIN